MVESIFQELPEQFVAGTAVRPMSFYFSLGECKRTVKITSDSCLVEEGRTVDSADCVCKTSPEFFEKIWKGDYRPGMKDFMAGTIKSNNPGALQDFLRCFGKSA